MCASVLRWQPESSAGTGKCCLRKAIKQPQSGLGSTNPPTPSLQWLIGHWHQWPSQSHNPNTILLHHCHASLEASRPPPCASLAKLLPLCLLFSHLKLLLRRLSSKTLQKIKKRKPSDIHSLSHLFHAHIDQNTGKNRQEKTATCQGKNKPGLPSSV